MIFTSFDPWLQHISQIQVARGLDQLEKLHHLSNKSLQIGSIITRVNTGEVLAVIGDRNSNYAGFNRALDANRQIGSLAKPAVYLRQAVQLRAHE